METLKQPFVFKQRRSGTSAKSGRPYDQVELHDPQTLENTSFFLQDGQTLDTSKLNFKDHVVADLAMDFVNGRIQPRLVGISKAQA